MSSPPPPVLMDELVEEVLLRLPPDEPAWLVHASAVCKPWRRILASRRFRRRYREFHRTPPLLGFFKGKGGFVPTSSLLPALVDRTGGVTMDCRHGRALFSDRTGGVTMDCRHGRALFSRFNRYGEPVSLIVLDPATGHQRRVPWPYGYLECFSAAVLCAAQGCDHLDYRGHFFVALVTTAESEVITSGWLYSSESHVWSDLTPVHHANVTSVHHRAVSISSHIAPGGSVLVGDALYFDANGIIECQVGTLHLSVFKKPVNDDGTLMTAEGGGLGFAAMVDVSNLTLWSREIGPQGSMEWAKIRVIDLKTLLSGLLKVSNYIISLVTWGISGSVEGTQAIFVRTWFGLCMVNLKSGRVRMLSCHEEILTPYMRFYFPAMEAACTGQGQ